MEGGPPAEQHGPTRVGKYELRKVIGRGSIGVVYDATDLVLKRKVAIKTLPFIDLDTPLGQEQYQRFQREAQAAARLYHPNIAITFDYGETDAFAYIVMEHIDGPSVRELLEKTRADIGQIRTIMHGLLAGLQHSHDLGVVHRDIKPANILLTPQGEVKITDFGIAHLDGSDLTQLGSQVGTPAYMSPEQVLGDKVDARSDVYSAGVVLYEMLTGSRPFRGSTNSVMHKIVHAPAPRVSESTAAFPPALDTVVATVLAKDPNDRYQSAAAFSAAIAENLHHADPAVAGPVPIEFAADSTIVRPGDRSYEITATAVAPPATPPPRRPRTSVVVPLLGAACVVIAGAVWLSVRQPAGRHEAQPIAASHTNTRPGPAPHDIAAIPTPSGSGATSPPMT
ncbi:MAG TPA: serine/threonine-protein kinase, partial [Acetobacteraceae bacterium]|nr:serine/threonine-protein kinase [Acetobacteraceae bacterium]